MADDGAHPRGLRFIAQDAQDDGAQRPRGLPRARVRGQLWRYADDALPPVVSRRRRRRVGGLGADWLLRSRALDRARRRRVHLDKRRQARVWRRGAGLPRRHQRDAGRVTSRARRDRRRRVWPLRRDGAAADAGGALRVRARGAPAAGLRASRRRSAGVARRRRLCCSRTSGDRRGAHSGGREMVEARARRAGVRVLADAGRGPGRRAGRRAWARRVGLPVLHGDAAPVFFGLGGTRLRI
mmetsp:Transcript_982/g.2672  ORF Transcript_982/g.2672 Transcript_982/m.2672 type:complete len:240 (+) Transcript_982:518-1237(+)